MLRNNLVWNVLWLSLLQGANFVAPLIALPYLVRVLGATEYGLYIFATVIISYFGLVCDYGFNLTGTRDISVHKNNKYQTRRIVSKIFIIKTGALLLAIFTFFTLSIFLQHIQDNLLLYTCAFSLLLGQTYFPSWFFQGIEDFKFIAILNCISRIIFTLFIFIIVKEPGDGYLAALMNSIGTLLVTILALAVMKFKHKVTLVKINLKTVWKYAAESFFVFLAQMKISLFSSVNILILGLISGPTAVGYFSVAEKLMRAMAQIQIPLVGALYPKMAHDLVLNREKSIRLIKKILLGGTIFYILTCGIVFFISEPLIELLFGSDFGPSVIALQIILVCPLLIFQNNIFGTQLLLNLGKEKTYFAVVSATGILNIVAVTVLTEMYGFIGTSISLLIAEVCVAAGMFYFAKDYLFNQKKLNNEPTRVNQ